MIDHLIPPELLAEDTANYAGLLLAPAKGFGFRPDRINQKMSTFFLFLNGFMIV